MHKLSEMAPTHLEGRTGLLLTTAVYTSSLSFAMVGIELCSHWHRVPTGAGGAEVSLLASNGQEPKYGPQQACSQAFTHADIHTNVSDSP